MTMPDCTPQDEPVSSKKIYVGWREWLSLPDLGITAIKAKVDTGARTSALHTFALEPYTQDQQLRVRFGIHPNQRSDDEIWCDAAVIDQRDVTDSGGHTESRYVIETNIVIGSYSWPIEMTLTNRENMLFRMLLGRTAMKRGGLLVNPARSYLASKKPKNDLDTGEE